PDVNALFNQALAALERAGAILVNIDENPGSWSSMGEMQSEVLSYEFKTGLNDYLQSTPDSVQVRTLQALIAFNRNHAEMEMPLFDQSLLLTAQSKGGLDDAPYREALTSIQKTTRSQGIDHLLAHHNVSVLVAPSGPMAPLIDPVYGDTWPIFPGAGFMAAIAGYPHLTVPAGTAHHLPVGLSFIGGHNQDAAVLSYGYAYEQHSNQRAEPQYLSTVEASADVAAAMAPSKQ
ncbi:MAG: amidase family protein, partial [Porticoccaceae bacterium]|nr:amidase family protein [Porticoccaceae bacterium]